MGFLACAYLFCNSSLFTLLAIAFASAFCAAVKLFAGCDCFFVDEETLLEYVPADGEKPLTGGGALTEL